jgi:hypothetical protein
VKLQDDDGLLFFTIAPKWTLSEIRPNDGLFPRAAVEEDVQVVPIGPAPRTPFPPLPPSVAKQIAEIPFPRPALNLTWKRMVPEPGQHTSSPWLLPLYDRRTNRMSPSPHDLRPRDDA